MFNHRLVRETPAPVTPSDLEAAAACQVLYMGMLYPAAKRIGNHWYHETPEGYKPFDLQGRVRPVVERQHARQ